ncbi:hypothetical protein WJX82_009076 [Trebouxia sp. C0006]
MSGKVAESQGQRLSPRKWYPASSAQKHGPVIPVDKAAQFVPLLDWQEDRRPSREVIAPHHKLKATPAQQATTVVLHRLSTAAATSDASISSSDEEFDPSRKPRRRVAGLLQREQALQASVNKGSIRLADNGARLAGRQSRHDAQPRDLDIRGRHSARQGHGDPNHSPRKGRQIAEQDTRPAKRQRQQGSSRSLQSQRQAWMHKLTSDAAQEAARLEAEAWAAEYEPSWTYQDNQGLSQGPFQLAELKAMTAQGSLQGSTMVHDEEAEISIRLDTLIANSQRSRSSIGHLGSPESLPNAAGDAADGLSDSHQAADAGAGLTVGIQEAPPVFDNMPRSDTAEQSGEPVDTPVEPVWSPQYSPNRLASLIPENQPPVSNPNSHDQSDSQDQHPQGSANTAGPPGHEAPSGSANAPGSFQSEQQPNASVYKQDGYSPLAHYDAHDNRPEGPVGSQPDAYHGHSEQSSGAVYDPYIPEAFHGNSSHSSGMQHGGSMQQLAPPQADSMHKQYQPDNRPVADAEYRPSHYMEGLPEGPPDRVYYEQGYRPGQEQQEDAEPQEGGRGGYEAPLTAEEAEWEWQRQLAEQQDSQDEDVWYDDAHPGEHPPAYDDGYGLYPQSPSAHWQEDPPEGGAVGEDAAIADPIFTPMLVLLGKMSGHQRRFEKDAGPSRAAPSGWGPVQKNLSSSAMLQGPRSKQRSGRLDGRSSDRQSRPSHEHQSGHFGQDVSYAQQSGYPT